MADIARFPVYVDEEAFAEDREHASAAGREMADRERALRARWHRARRAEAV